MQTTRRLLGLMSIAVLLASAPVSFAQAIYGSITGTVADATGAVIPGATITIVDVAKGTTVTATSNASGEFTVEHLIPDTYNVKVTASGFKGYETNGLPVSADTSRKVEAVMQTGATGETITVSADSVPQLKTDKADVATVFNAQEVEELPIPDHNFTNLQLLLPGAVQLGWAHAASENPQGSKQIQIDGQAFGGVNYTLDGTDNQDAILGIIVINPNSESMSEVKIATQNFDAEFGKAVASVQTVQTKSGTNAFHGTVFDNRESNANLARDPFTVSKAAGYLGGLKNQFGGSIGGPVLKDKIFFFGDYQGVRQRSGGSGIGSVPSLFSLSKAARAHALASNGVGGLRLQPVRLETALQPPDLRQLYGCKPNAVRQQHHSVEPGFTRRQPIYSNCCWLADTPQTRLLQLRMTMACTTTTPAAALASSTATSSTFAVTQHSVNEKIHVFGRFSRFYRHAERCQPLWSRGRSWSGYRRLRPEFPRVPTTHSLSVQTSPSTRNSSQTSVSATSDTISLRTRTIRPPANLPIPG